MTLRKYLTQTEIASMLQSAQAAARFSTRDYCLLYMSFIHGFRVSETCHLRLSDLDLRHGSVYIRRIKNGFSTTHPLLPQEIVVIRAWLAERGALRGADKV